MYQFVIVIHVLLGLGVIGLVMMQQGKGADAGAAFGAGASGTVFGAQGSASFLSRTTAVLATLFFVTSLTLAILSGASEKAVDLMEEPTNEIPEVPVAMDSDAAPIKVPALDDVPAALESQSASPDIPVPSADADENAQPIDEK